MSETVRAAVEESVQRAKLDGEVLAVIETAERIVHVQGAVSDLALYQVARELIEEAARRGVAMEFSRAFA